MITIEELKKQRESNLFMGFNGAEGPTPIWICDSQIQQIPINYNDPNLVWLFPAAGHGTYAILVYWKYMEGLSEIFIDSEERSRHILKNMLYLNEINPWLCRQLCKQGFINVIEGDYLNHEFKMKFDVNLGNPPFTVGKNNPVWYKFVEKSFDLVKTNGYVSLIHPNGWRNVSGRFKNVQELIKSKKCHHIEMFDVKKGREIFGVDTPFDWYVIENEDNNGGNETSIVFQDGTINTLNIKDMDFIPNFNIDVIMKMIANDDEECVEILHSESLYEVRKPHMSPTRSEEHNLPCVYSVLKDGSFSLKYSSEDRGHFGVPKLILGNGANPTCFIDYDGSYGMTQFSFGIVDEIHNLEKIKDVIEGDKFKRVVLSVKYVATAGNPLIYPKIAKLLRKDFWKEFIDE
jgi:hypothetical protein